MKILFAIAHPNEMKIIRQAVKELQFSGVDFSYSLLGVGNYETIHNLTKVFEKDSFDFMINIGICGYSGDKTGLIQISRIFNLHLEKELIVPISFRFATLSSIGCSEKPVIKEEELCGERFIDMESRGVEFIANKYRIPRLILKLPADKVGDKFNPKLLVKSCEELSSCIDYKTLIETVIKYIGSIGKKESFNYLKNHYRFTFAEFEILKFKINKYETLSENGFSDYFQSNNSKNKEEFMKGFDLVLKDLENV